MVSANASISPDGIFAEFIVIRIRRNTGIVFRYDFGYLQFLLPNQCRSVADKEQVVSFLRSVPN